MKDEPSPPASLEIKPDDLTGPEILMLLREHLRSLSEISPPESCHALNLEELRGRDITFWSVWCDGQLAGCGALKHLEPCHGEIKSMRTASSHLRRGVAAKVLNHIISEAKRRGYRRLSLETGAMDYFRPAHALYHKFGFIECPPFGAYVEDANSVYMTREL